MIAGLLKILGAVLLAITGLTLVGFVPTDGNIKRAVGAGLIAALLVYIYIS